MIIFTSHFIALYLNMKFPNPPMLSSHDGLPTGPSWSPNPSRQINNSIMKAGERWLKYKTRVLRTRNIQKQHNKIVGLFPSHVRPYGCRQRQADMTIIHRCLSVGLCGQIQSAYCNSSRFLILRVDRFSYSLKHWKWYRSSLNFDQNFGILADKSENSAFWHANTELQQQKWPLLLLSKKSAVS